MNTAGLRLLGGILLLASGQFLIVDHVLPLAYFYFPLVWYGYILTLDGGLSLAGRSSPLTTSPRACALLIPVSASFWWLFELFNLAVHNWRYINTGAFSGAGYVAFASVCFSTVLLAVWETASILAEVTGAESMPKRLKQLLESRVTGIRHKKRDQNVFAVAFAAGILCLILPVLFPHYAFPLIWASVFLILDPLNGQLGWPSLLREVTDGRWSTAILFAISALVCGFFWEFWNYWAAVRWVYSVPFVSQVHLFEMPLPGYLGYLPFGLEVFAATVTTVSLVHIGTKGHYSQSPQSRKRDPLRPVVGERVAC